MTTGLLSALREGPCEEACPHRLRHRASINLPLLNPHRLRDRASINLPLVNPHRLVRQCAVALAEPSSPTALRPHF